MFEISGEKTMLVVLEKEDHQGAHFVFSDYFTKELKYTETFDIQECQALARNLNTLVKKMKRNAKNDLLKNTSRKQTAKLLTGPVAH